MTAEKTKPEVKQATAKEPEVSEPESVPTYTVDRLLEDAYPLTGFTKSVLTGALLGKTGKLTAAQAQSAADKFLNSKVPQEG